MYMVRGEEVLERGREREREREKEREREGGERMKQPEKGRI